MNKRILDPCCGSKMFWFDPDNPDVLFCDNRELDEETIWTSRDGKQTRTITVKPDLVCDVRQLPFEDNTFYHVVLDPPHLQKVGDSSWLCKKYGKLEEDWPTFIRQAFDECMRVLKPNGTLIFKWNERDIKVKDILDKIPYKPLYGHRSGKRMDTHWMAFMKGGTENE